MFFFIAVVSGREELGPRRCGRFPCCGTVGAAAPVTCVFQRFILFFIPLFRFGRRYFVSCPNCGAVYEIEPEEGRRIERDPAAEIDPERMHRVSSGRAANFCPNCGSPVPLDARYCPRCGTRL
jgi:endogenous inhibitor of DNA gyrase (YacG/DUF329 family)